MGRWKQSCESLLAKERPVGYRTDVGALPNPRLRDLMAAADILFLPSAWEGIAQSIYEAMAAGLVVVGADVGGQRELVTPDCGYLLSPGIR